MLASCLSSSPVLPATTLREGVLHARVCCEYISFGKEYIVVGGPALRLDQDLHRHQLIAIIDLDLYHHQHITIIDYGALGEVAVSEHLSQGLGGGVALSGAKCRTAGTWKIRWR